MSPAVNREKVFVGCHERCYLIHLTTQFPAVSPRATVALAMSVDIDVSFLRLLAELGYIVWGELQSGAELLYEVIRGGLECGGAREASSEGDRGGNDGVEGRDAARAVHEGHHPLEVGGPEGSLALHLPGVLPGELGDGELVVPRLSRGGRRDESAVP